jgi:N-acetylmuramoyl-L-alanine amidase CwlA
MTTLAEYAESLEIIQDFIPLGIPTRSGRRIQPKFITIHNTSNAAPGANAAAHNRYIRSNDAINVRGVSWHFTVDDDQIYYHVPFNEKAIHAGNGNSVSIGIEICMNRDMDIAAGYTRAARLVAYCHKVLNIRFPEGLVQHNNWTGKDCPIVLRHSTQMSWQIFQRLVAQQIGNIDNLPRGILPFSLDELAINVGKKSENDDLFIDEIVLKNIGYAFEAIGHEDDDDSDDSIPNY